MGQACLEQRRLIAIGIGPVQKALHLGRQGLCGRCLKVQPAPAQRAGDHLHRAVGIIAPAANGNGRHAGVTGREQGGMPAVQALGAQGLGAAGGGVEHHVHHALGVAIDGGQRADVHAQTSGDGRAHGCRVQRFALDGAGPDHVLGQCGQAGLGAQRQTGIGQPAQQQTLRAADLGQRPAQRLQVIAPMGPLRLLPDIGGCCTCHARITRWWPVSCKRFSA